MIGNNKITDKDNIYPTLVCDPREVRNIFKEGWGHDVLYSYTTIATIHGDLNVS